MKKYCMLSLFLALSQYSEGIEGIKTYIVGTDKTYLQPTIQTIHSLNRNTSGQKRIIVLETDNIYGTEEEEKAFAELPLEDNVTLLRWKLSDLINNVDSDIKGAYDKFCTTVSDEWKNYETVTARALFPVLFNKDNLEKTGYAKSLGSTPTEQSLNHFVWLDSDIVAWKNLNDFYELSSNLPTNSSGIVQPVMSVELTYIFQGLASYKAGMLEDPYTSGGVVFWNLDICRKLLQGKDTLIQLLRNSKYTDEVFVNNLLKFWVEESDGFYVADKLFNSLPHCWLQTKCYYNFLKLLNAAENDRNEYIEKVVDFWPVEHLEKAISGEEPVQNKEKSKIIYR